MRHLFITWLRNLRMTRAMMNLSSNLINQGLRLVLWFLNNPNKLKMNWHTWMRTMILEVGEILMFQLLWIICKLILFIIRLIHLAKMRWQRTPNLKSVCKTQQVVECQSWANRKLHQLMIQWLRTSHLLLLLMQPVVVKRNPYWPNPLK